MAKLFALLVSILTFISFSELIFAAESPVLTNPVNNSTVSSSKLTWETPAYTLYSNNPYRIQVDNDSDFSSVYRDYTTKNTYYTPILFEGTWHWRAKAKDSNAIWSEWSNSWSFVLSSTIASPSPSPSTSSTPTPSPTPSPSTATSTFSISNAPTTINSDQSFSVNINLFLPSNPNTDFYLKGAFKKSDSSNYFGFTKVNNDWIKNSSSYSNQYKITTDLTGNWSGNLEVKPDANDSGFTGSGDYIFKVGRYTSSGSGPTWSNEESVTINSQVSKDTTPPTTIQSSPNVQGSNPTFSSKSIITTNTTTKLPSLKNTSSQSASLGIATESATVAAYENKEQNFNFPIRILSTVSGVGIIFSTAIWWYLRYRKGKIEL